MLLSASLAGLIRESPFFKTLAWTGYLGRPLIRTLHDFPSRSFRNEPAAAALSLDILPILRNSVRFVLGECLISERNRLGKAVNGQIRQQQVFHRLVVIEVAAPHRIVGILFFAT